MSGYLRKDMLMRVMICSMLLISKTMAQDEASWIAFQETRVIMEECAQTWDGDNRDFSCMPDAYIKIRKLAAFEGKRLPSLTYEIFCFEDYFDQVYRSNLHRYVFPENFDVFASIKEKHNSSWVGDFSDDLIWSGKGYKNGFVAGSNNEVLFFQNYDGELSVYHLDLPEEVVGEIDYEAPFRFRCSRMDLFTLKKLAWCARWSIGGHPELPQLAGDWQADTIEDLVLMVVSELQIPFVRDGDTLVFSDAFNQFDDAPRQTQLRRQFEQSIRDLGSDDTLAVFLEPGLVVSSEMITLLSGLGASQRTLSGLVAANGWCEDQVHGQYRLGSCFWIAEQRAGDVADARVHLARHLARHHDHFQMEANLVSSLLDLLAKQPDALFLLNDSFEGSENGDQGALSKVLNHLQLHQCDAAERELLMQFRTKLDVFAARRAP